MKNRPAPEDLTRLLQEWRVGSSEAQEELWPVIYHELKSLARGVLRRRSGPAGLATTTLLHEAYTRLVGSGSKVSWNDRQHFYAVAARAMRFVLVDHARQRLSKKRGEGAPPAELAAEPADPTAHRPEELMAVHQALGKLAKIHPRYEKLVEMRYFAGFSVDEAADLLEVSRPTAVRDWRAARTWLYSELQRGWQAAPN